jgi:predicted acylesterase/phospholipase RssA
MREKTFHIGLCMAGAVSAGAYTAGVMDYLIEALEEWEKRRGTDNTPNHKVVISVIGGASAGGMTGMVTAATVNAPKKPIQFDGSADLLKIHPENKFYHSWVDLLGNEMMSKMLNPADIEKNKRVDALLNAAFVDEIADKAFAKNEKEWVPTPAYFAEQLKLFTTLTNLEGLKYNITFNSDISSKNYNMAVHNDYACFNLNAADYLNDGWIPLNFKDELNKDMAKEAAMATGAFPIGLQSRILQRPLSSILDNPWLNKTSTIGNATTKEIYKTQNVDGGLINNEPFEKVRELLNIITQQYNAEDLHAFNQFKSTVLMIDPFPSELPNSFKIDQQLFSTIGYTLNAITQQMRAKPAPLIDAMAPDKAGQFLIAPTRPIQFGNQKGKKIEGSAAIACGAFDGFSGFMHKEFRIHDFYLGRYNCEMFLRNYFTVPAKDLDAHPIFSEGYKGIDKSAFKSFHDDAYQIIPIFSTIEKSYYPMPVFSSGNHWPSINATMVKQFEPAIKKRVEAILLYAFPLTGFWGFILRLAAKWLLSKKIGQKLVELIIGSLEKHGLINRTPQNNV